MQQVPTPSREARGENGGLSLATCFDLTPCMARATHLNLLELPCIFTQVQTGSDLQQAAPDRNGYRMRPVIGPQLTYQVLNVEIDGGLRDRQLIGNLLVAIAVSNEPEHLQLPSRKIFLAQVLGEPGCHLRWNVPTAHVDRTHHLQQF